jgi:hypothetical protein
MPAFEVITKLLIEHAGSHLEQPMCTGHRPSHLLLLDEPFAAGRYALLQRRTQNGTFDIKCTRRPKTTGLM